MTTFGPFRLDEAAGRLWHGDSEIRLRAKSFAVLCELVRRRGRLVTKEELFRACWPDTTVSATVLRVCIREIRAALGDDGCRPAVLETVGRRGYRLLVEDDADTDATPATTLVGRDRELAALRRAYARADSGLRQVVFVTGEPGLGKTTLLEHFAEELRATTRARVALGQCVELIGDSEAYLPILDLLGRLSREADGREVVATFERWAPSWLLQMPALIDDARAEAIRRRVVSPSRDRMLRELAEMLETLAAERPLVLVLEDLHWSDTSTIDALAYLAQRTKPARLLLIGSYRPVDVALRDHPLKGVKQSLQARERCTEIALELLTRADTETWVARKLSSHEVDPAVARELYARTDGHPLFLASLIYPLEARGILAVRDGRWCLTAPLTDVVPDSVRQLAQQQLGHLSPDERSVLDAASIVGNEFAVAAVAAATGDSPDVAETTCTSLTALGFLVPLPGLASWPDGTVSARYAFRHSLFRGEIDRALAPTARRRLHAAIGERLERAYGERSGEIAPTLAFHFSRAGDDARAARYHREAAAAAKRRFADREVITHVQAALEHLGRLPETEDRLRTELGCLLDLGGAYFAARGCASDDAVAAHRRALEVADRLDQPLARVQAHGALYTFHVMRAELPRAKAIAEDLLATAERLQVPFFSFLGHVTLGSTLFNLGDVPAAREHLTRAQALWTPDMPSLPLDPTVVCRTMLGFSALLEGRPGEGHEWIARALEYAEAAGNPYNLSYAREVAAQYFATAGERERARTQADSAAEIALEHEFPIHTVVATLVRGWADRDAEAVRAGIAAYEAHDQLLATSLFRGLLVEVLLEQGDVASALDEIDAALAFTEHSSEMRHAAELHRLRGTALLRRGDDAGAAAAFARALEIARAQGAHLWTLRTALAAAELHAAQGRHADARRLLDEACAPFTAEPAPPELAAARTLYDELDGQAPRRARRRASRS